MRILLACLCNTSRSPMARGALEAAAARAGLALVVDSAGTGVMPAGGAPNRHAVAAAAARGLDIATHRARPVVETDFHEFDLICAMDSETLGQLRDMEPAASGARLALLLDFAPQSVLRSIPGPAEDDPAGFVAALDLIETGVAGLIAAVRSAGQGA